MQIIRATTALHAHARKTRRESRIFGRIGSNTITIIDPLSVFCTLLHLSPPPLPYCFSFMLPRLDAALQGPRVGPRWACFGLFRVGGSVFHFVGWLAPCT